MIGRRLIGAAALAAALLGCGDDDGRPGRGPDDAAPPAGGMDARVGEGGDCRRLADACAPGFTCQLQPDGVTYACDAPPGRADATPGPTPDRDTGVRPDAGDAGDCRDLSRLCGPGFDCVLQPDDTYRCQPEPGADDAGVHPDAAPGFVLDGAFALDRDGNDLCPGGPTAQPRVFMNLGGLRVQVNCQTSGATVDFDTFPEPGQQASCVALNSARQCPVTTLDGTRHGTATGTVRRGEDGRIEGECRCEVEPAGALEGYTLSVSFELPVE
ncbi:MAG: hypothetical protein H6704_22435 [Myxococcales bacterium]|nr:hypothetical protein [Myxococcales bacterium]